MKKIRNFTMLFALMAIACMLITSCKPTVYVAGYESHSTGNAVAKYWKNGVATELTDGAYHAEVYDIAVSGSDVYVAGYEENSNGNDVAKYWKNGTPTVLTDGSTNTCAYAIAVSGNDVYVAGCESYSSNEDVYVAGNEENNSNEDAAYVVVCEEGLSGYMVAKYWKNGVATDLTDETYYACANAIAVSGSDVYVAEDESYSSGYGVAAYWKNGKATGLSADRRAYSTYALSIVVK